MLWTIRHYLSPSAERSRSRTPPRKFCQSGAQPGYDTRLTPSYPCSHVLIDKDWIAIRIHRDEAGWSCGALVRLLGQLHSLCLELALQLADVGKRGKLLGVAVPSGV